MSVISVMVPREDEARWRKPRPASQTEGVESGFDENFDAAWTETELAGRTNARRDTLYKAYKPIVDALNQDRPVIRWEGWRPVYNRLSVPGEFSDSYDGGETERAETAIFSEIAKRRLRDPGFLPGVAGDAATFRQQLLARQTKALAAATEVQSRRSWSGVAGGVLASAIKGFDDPAAIAMLPVGGGGGGSMVRIFARETLVNTLGAALVEPAIMDRHEELGQKMTLGQAMGDVLVSGVAGGGLEVSVHGAGRAVNAFTPTEWKLAQALKKASPAQVSDRAIVDAFDASVPPHLRTPEQQAVLNVARREFEIDETSPFKASHASAGVHRGKMTEAMVTLADPAPRASTPAAQVGGTFDMGRFMGRNRAAESSGNDVAKAATSSAYGRYQFLKSTWLDSYKRTFGATGETDAQILAKRADGAVQDRVMQTFTAGNVRALRSAQVPVDDGTVYLAHFLGSRDAVRVLKAAGDTPIGELVSAASIRANPGVFGRVGSASELVSWARRKMQQEGGASVPARAGAIGDGADAGIDADIAALAEERAVIAEQRAALAAEEGRASDGPATDMEPAPQLRRDLFESDIEWRIAQSKVEAEELGLTAPLFGRREAWAETRDSLMAAQGGEVRGALWHPEVGAIDVKWGDAKGGLAHIAAKHPEVLDQLPEILDAMEVASQSENRVRLESPDHKAVVRLDYDGEAQKWLLTAFEVKKGKVPPAAEDGGAARGARDRSPSAGTEGDIGASGSVAKVPDDLRAALTPYPPPSMGLGESGFYTFQDGQGRTIAWHPGDGVANGAAPKRTGVTADDVREWLGRPRQDVADPRMGDSQLAAFDDPAGAAVAAQVEGLAHDVRAAIDAGEMDGVAFAALDGREATGAAEVLAKLDADDAALKALRGCL